MSASRRIGVLCRPPGAATTGPRDVTEYVGEEMLTHPAQSPSRRLSDRLRTAGSVAWSIVGLALPVAAAILLIIGAADGKR